MSYIWKTAIILISYCSATVQCPRKFIRAQNSLASLQTQNTQDFESSLDAVKSPYIFHNVLLHTMSTIKKYTHNNTSPNKKFENVLVSQNTNVGSEKNSIVKEYVYVIINNVTIYLCITEYTGTMM